MKLPDITGRDQVTAVMEDDKNQNPARYRVIPLKPEKPLERQGKAKETFSKLIIQLEGIDENLKKQSEKHQELLQKIEDIPEILKSFREATRSQRQFIETVAGEMKRREFKEQQFYKAAGRVLGESGKQIRVLCEMNRKLSASADAGVQLDQGLDRFNDILTRLDANAVNQTNSILQMNRTFTASDIYMKHIMSKQSRRFMWIYTISAGICLAAIAGLTIGIFLVQGK